MYLVHHTFALWQYRLAGTKGKALHSTNTDSVSQRAVAAGQHVQKARHSTVHRTNAESSGSGPTGTNDKAQHAATLTAEHANMTEASNHTSGKREVQALDVLAQRPR